MVSPDGGTERIENAEIELFRDGGRLIPDDFLRDMESFEDVMQMAAENDAALLDASDYVGSGAELLADKNRLVNVPFIFVQWRFNESTDFEDAWFVSANILTKHGEKFVINDGTMGGVRDQLHAITRKTGQKNFLVAKNGLTVSEYDVEENGKKKRARSYYIAS